MEKISIRINDLLKGRDAIVKDYNIVIVTAMLKTFVAIGETLQVPLSDLSLFDIQQYEGKYLRICRWFFW